MYWSGGELPRHILGETQLAKLFTRLRQGWFYIIEVLARRFVCEWLIRNKLRIPSITR
jgi:hypothetical protein